MSSLHNNHEDDKIVEDSPRLRSMAISSAVSSPAMLGVNPRLGASAKPLFASPLLSSKQQQLATTSSSSSKQSLEEEPAWPNLTVLPLPAFHCLERTHVQIATTSSPEVVAQRITECLRQDSIAVQFAKNEATANTADCVNFSIRLWMQQDAKLVVEVQRLSGCGYAYQQLARKILRAAKGGDCSSEVASSLTRTFKLPSCVPQETQQEREQCIEQGLEIAESLLSQNKMDTQLLAMESLLQISTCCPKARSFAAKSILSPKYTFLNTLTCLIETHRLDSTTLDAHATSDLEDGHYAKLHRHALQVMANCLATLADAGELEQVLAQPEVTLSSDESLVRALAQDVAQSEKLPHDATQALRCLQSLCRCSKACACANRMALGGSSGDLLAAAQRYGLRRHAQLQEQATQLQLQLQQQQRDH